MKKILSVLMILALFVLIFSLAACGDKAKDDIKNEMTTIKENATSMLDDLSSALNGIDNEMTQNGNVTKDNSSTGLFDDMTSDKDKTTKNDAATENDTKENPTTKESTENLQ